MGVRKINIRINNPISYCQPNTLAKCETLPIINIPLNKYCIFFFKKQLTRCRYIYCTSIVYYNQLNLF